MDSARIEEASRLAAELVRRQLRISSEGEGLPQAVAEAIADRPHAIDRSVLSPSFYAHLETISHYMSLRARQGDSYQLGDEHLQFLFSAITALIDENTQLKLKCDGLATEILRMPLKFSTPNFAGGVR